MGNLVKRIFWVMVASLVMSLPQLVFAEGPQRVSPSPNENAVATVPFIPENDTSDSDQVMPPAGGRATSERHAGSSDSPVSVNHPERIPAVPPSTGAVRSSPQEVGKVVDDVLSQMVDAGREKELSEVLNYISKGDYERLVEFHKNNTEFLDSLTRSIQQSSADSPSGVFRDDWLKGAGNVQAAPSVEAVSKLYAPIAERIAEVLQGLAEAGSVSEVGSEKPSASGLLKNFSNRAREFIVSSFSRAQTNLANGMLSNPLEATAFAAETAPVLMPGNAGAVREMTVAEAYAKGKRYQVIDSVYIGREFLYAQKMLHPPANLHPYLKWLLYTRNLTPRMVENYLATREAVGAIYEQAKAGRGNIRYRDKVYGAFLPFAETAAGNYELVKPASAE